MKFGLIQVVQGSALVTMALNIAALWKQEARGSVRTVVLESSAKFLDSWREFTRHARAVRFLVTVGLGTAAFNMQDIVLEPYGGEILHLPVAATTALTAMLAGGMLAAFLLAARFLVHGADPYRVAAYGTLVGLVAFAAVIFAAPMESPLMFRLGVLMIGFGAGFFLVGTLVRRYGARTQRGDRLGAGRLGRRPGHQRRHSNRPGRRGARWRHQSRAAWLTRPRVLTGASSGYTAVYQIEIVLLFATLIAIGPLVRSGNPSIPRRTTGHGVGLIFLMNVLSKGTA